MSTPDGRDWRYDSRSGRLAQPVRARGSHPRGHWFEPSIAHHALCPSAMRAPPAGPRPGPRPPGPRPRAAVASRRPASSAPARVFAAASPSRGPGFPPNARDRHIGRRLRPIHARFLPPTTERAESSRQTVASARQEAAGRGSPAGACRSPAGRATRNPFLAPRERRQPRRDRPRGAGTGDRIELEVRWAGRLLRYRGRRCGQRQRGHRQRGHRQRGHRQCGQRRSGSPHRRGFEERGPARSVGVGAAAVEAGTRAIEAGIRAGEAGTPGYRSW